MDSPLQIAHLDAEVACLGACLLDADAARLVAEQLRPHDFTRDAYAAVHAAVVRLVSRGQRVDRLTLTTELRLKDPATPASTVLDLEEAVPTAGNVRQYLSLVRQATVRRQVREACRRTMQAMEDPEASVPETVGHLAEDVESYVGGESDGGRALVPVKLAEALKRWMAETDAHNQPRKVSTPSAALNRTLGGGFGPGELIYLGARPGAGKTALALEIARQAGQHGTGCLIISREMVVASLTRRILSQSSRILSSRIKTGLFTDQDYPHLVKTYGHLATLPIWLSDQAVSLQEIVRLVERWSFTPPLGLLIVDYLQLVRHKSESRRMEVEAVSQGLKTLALKTGIPVLCLSSLRRPSLEAQDARPGLADLRESGELEHDADVVIFLHRPMGEEETEVIVAKNRDGRVGKTFLRFRPEFVAFDESEGE